jgi:hypothetical protein
MRPLMDIVADFTAGPPNVPGVLSVSLNSVGTTTQAWAVSRGTQYELGNAEAGTMTVSLNDPKENANPINTSSTWNSGASLLLPLSVYPARGVLEPVDEQRGRQHLQLHQLPAEQRERV